LELHSHLDQIQRVSGAPGYDGCDAALQEPFEAHLWMQNAAAAQEAEEEEEEEEEVPFLSLPYGDKSILYFAQLGLLREADQIQ
jgi:hypothetical protein